MNKRPGWCSLALLLVVAAPPGRGQPIGLGQPARLDIPDVVLIDQDGAPHHVRRELIEGKIAVVSFVFTGCSTICSPVGASMGALDRLLGARVSLLSVTLDPFNDTPERLAMWRRQFDDEPGWRLLTGDPGRIGRLLHAMREDVPDISQHDAFLWLGDPRTGNWTRVSALVSPETIAGLVRQLAAE
jgi:protein SCO1/2